MSNLRYNIQLASTFRSKAKEKAPEKVSGGPELPVLPLLQYLDWVEATRFLDGGNAVLLGVVRHHGSRLCWLAGGLGLWRHYWGGSRGN